MNQQKRFYSQNHVEHLPQHFQHTYQPATSQLNSLHYQPSIPEQGYSNSLPSYPSIAIKTESHPHTSHSHHSNTHSSSSHSNQPIYHIMETSRDNPMLTQSAPIPCTGKMLTDLVDLNYDLDQSQSPLMAADGTYITASNLFGLDSMNSNSNQMWNLMDDVLMTKKEPFQIDDDHIFQVDNVDLLQSPTLAELNGDATFGDLNIDELIVPDQMPFMSNASTMLHLSSFNDSSMPQQLMNPLHQTHIDQSIQHQGDTIQLLSQGKTMGREATEDQTNVSSPSPYEFCFVSTPKTFISNAAFSPDSQGSSSPLLNSSISPPPYILNNNTLMINNNNNNINVNNYNNNNNNNNNNNIDGISQNKMDCTMLEDLLKTESKLGQSVPGPSTLTPVLRNRQENYHQRRLQFAHQHSSGKPYLSSSAPVNSSGWVAQQMWQRREPRQHLLSTGSLAEAGSTSSLSTGDVVSPDIIDSHDEGYDDSDSEHYEDYSSDDDSGNDEAGTPRMGSSKKERFFWQYNVQAKGPKGQRLVIKTHAEDPHVLNEVTDPVFSPSCSVRGIKHSGKARKGDGNDLTPNPRKLQCIGKELDKLGRTINQMTSVNESPFKERPKLRKEKNKLASRACRLKKKAQHEANKIKLYGLETEHKRLINGIEDVKKALACKYGRLNENTDEINAQIDDYVVSATTFQIAGTSTEFVNKVLEKVKSGIPNGGLYDI